MQQSLSQLFSRLNAGSFQPGNAARRIPKRIFWGGLVLLVWCWLGSGIAVSAAVALPRQACHVTLFREPLFFRDPINRWSLWFENLPQDRFVGNGLLSLHYSCSTTLITDMSSMTILLNDKPIDSKRLSGQTGVETSWSVVLPYAYFKPGMNELKIETRQRSQQGICVDLDNAANWIELHPSSRLTLTRLLTVPYCLDSYPFPFVDLLSSQPVQTTFQLSSSYTDSELVSMLKTANDWGVRYPTVSLAPIVQTGDTKRVNTPHAMQFSSTLHPGHDGFLSISTRGTRAVMAISGDSAISADTPGGLSRATLALSSPTYISNARTSQDVVPRYIPDPPPTAQVRYGTCTLAELGISDITLKGAFTQQAVITVKRPVKIDLSRISFLELNFRHAAALQNMRSMLSVSLNNTYMGSIRLTDVNANQGTLRLPFPIGCLAEPVWVFRFTVYHDLGTVACDKWHESIAWTVIDAGTSTVGLTLGTLIGDPYLDQLVVARKKTGLYNTPVYIWLPEQPSDSQLTLAAAIAVRFGQANLAQASWEIIHGDPAAKRPQGIVCVIGMPRSMPAYASLAKAGFINISDAENYTTKLPIPNSALSSAAILQAVTNPWDHDGALYLFYTPSARMDRGLANLITDPQRLVLLHGPVSLLYPDGTVTVIPTISDTEQKARVLRERNSYSPLMQLIALIILVLLASTVIWLVRVIMRKPVAPTDGLASPG